MRDLATLWVGHLGPIEYASIASFLRHGHRLTVYSYDRLAGLPAGVEGRDANEILPAKQVAIYSREGSPSLHSNFFRYALMERTESVWVDLDIIALRPFDFPGDRIYAHENPERVNCAVLRMPRNSPALAELLRFRPGMRGIAPHITGLRRLKYRIKTLGRGVPIEEWPWGSTGPRALSAYLRRHDEMKYALPAETFYPVAPQECEKFVRPGALSDDDFGAGTYGVHLSASNVQKMLLRDFGGEIPGESFPGQHVAKARAAGYL
ncbi:hypothetical protein SAMN04487972_11351 [Paracoccus halophilus]|uniref:Galactosyltransferase Lgt5 n=1 Tax=Paracoccus halophilus TaxID=376733 RepID=A0A099F1M0_9RHOB|nr:hypothetical protein [Paracoccus halophilus]KGJ04354.1 hypothetical protein IT41_10655 [Paracoccus halophilus]SFA55171.1 hypothetical protein SAMN04487972_11351 [Paracoccus halophilus]